MIVDLTADRIEETAVFLFEVFRARTEAWPDLDAARAEVAASLAPGRISRIALSPAGEAVGWIGGISQYDGNVWEVHPLAVRASHQRRGVGTALVRDLEALVAARGALTLWAGSDDEAFETSLGGADLYADLPSALRDARGGGAHALGFYLRLGFTIVGVMPDANGRGKPDIFLAKRIGPETEER